jgi:hypothetical protein
VDPACCTLLQPRKCIIDFGQRPGCVKGPTSSNRSVLVCSGVVVRSCNTRWAVPRPEWSERIALSGLTGLVQSAGAKTARSRRDRLRLCYVNLLCIDSHQTLVYAPFQDHGPCSAANTQPEAYLVIRDEAENMEYLAPQWSRTSCENRFSGEKLKH